MDNTPQLPTKTLTVKSCYNEWGHPTCPFWDYERYHCAHDDSTAYEDYMNAQRESNEKYGTRIRYSYPHDIFIKKCPLRKQNTLVVLEQ